MPYSVLKITDGTAAGTVNLMSIMSGFHVKSWKPSIAQYKDGGVWLDNVMAHGRKLKMRRFMNVTESIELMAVRCDIDSLIENIQDLRRLLERAADYWEYDHINTPIYIIAKTLYETNPRYAVVYSGSVPEDAELADPTFVSHIIADGLTLPLEHGLWQSTVPGTGDCVEVSSVRTVHLTAISSIISADELISEDDCYVKNENAVLSISLNSPDVIFLYQAAAPYLLYLNGLRFRNVDIPAGATIVSAYVTFTASDDRNNDVYVNIVGEADVDPDQYSTWADYMARLHTTAYVVWWIATNWVTDIAYNSDDISAIIQEIIGLPGWAAGNDLALHFDTLPVNDGNSRTAYSWDGTGDAPVLHVIYTVAADVDFGRAATCLPEVFVANKHNLAQLTDIYTYDDSTGLFSGNLINATKPEELFPDPIGDGDCLYIGIRNSITSHGPFCSVVFDVGLPLFATGPVVFATQYYNGAPNWNTLYVYSALTYGVLPFTAAGVQSHHWVQPDDWISTTVNGIAGMWMRWLLVSGYADVAQIPTQQYRDIYTITTPYVDIAADQLGGDIQTLLRAYIRNVSEHIAYDLNPPNRIIIAARDVARGANYTPYINISSAQNSANISLIIGADTAIADGNQYPTGHIYVYTAPAGAQALAPRICIRFAAALAVEYHGKFRAFLVADPSSLEFYVDLSIQTYLAGTWVTIYTSDYVPVPSHGVAIIDLGELDLPPFYNSGAAQIFGLNIDVGSTVGGGTLAMYYLWLVPVDDYVADLNEINAGVADLRSNYGIDIDSILNAKVDITSLMRYIYITASPLASWRAIAKTFELKPNAAYRIFTFCMHDATGGYFEYEYTAAHILTMYKAQRYLSMRGSR